jgi:hypothetical protein
MVACERQLELDWDDNKKMKGFNPGREEVSSTFKWIFHDGSVEDGFERNKIRQGIRHQLAWKRG